MNRCLSDQALLEIHAHEGAVADQAHLRGCHACADRYRQLADDLMTIGHVLAAPPPVATSGRGAAWGVPWMPVAVVGAALAVVLLDVVAVRRLSPVEFAAPSIRGADFAEELDSALFELPETNTLAAVGFETAALDAALDMGVPCTGDRYVSGECDDPLSSLVIEED